MALELLFDPDGDRCGRRIDIRPSESGRSDGREQASGSVRRSATVVLAAGSPEQRASSPPRGPTSLFRARGQAIKELQVLATRSLSLATGQATGRPFRQASAALVELPADTPLEERGKRYLRTIGRISLIGSLATLAVGLLLTES